jgi:hypothetical protein
MNTGSFQKWRIFARNSYLVKIIYSHYLFPNQTVRLDVVSTTYTVLFTIFRIADLSDVIMWGDYQDLGGQANSDYLWEDFSSWSIAGDPPFHYHPPSFSTLLNRHTFSNNGLQRRVFGVRPVVHPGKYVLICLHSMRCIAYSHFRNLRVQRFSADVFLTH